MLLNQMRRYFIYILKCKDGSYYTGVTNNLEQRFFEHQSGLIKNCYTHGRRPVKLVFHAEFQNIKQAIGREKQVKGWSRKKKEALIRGEFDLLPILSQRKT